MLKTQIVKKLLVERGRTREWLAKECVLSINSLNKYLSDANLVQPHPRVTKLMASILDVPAYLIDSRFRKADDSQLIQELRSLSA